MDVTCKQTKTGATCVRRFSTTHTHTHIPLNQIYYSHRGKKNDANFKTKKQTQSFSPQKNLGLSRASGILTRKNLFYEDQVGGKPGAGGRTDRTGRRPKNKKTAAVVSSIGLRFLCFFRQKILSLSLSHNRKRGSATLFFCNLPFIQTKIG